MKRRCFFSFAGGCSGEVNEQGYCETHLAGCRSRAIWHGQYKPTLQGTARLPGAWKPVGGVTSERTPVHTDEPAAGHQAER